MITETLFNAENITANSPQIEKLKALFPNCFDTSGRFLLEKFQAEISDHAEISREFYSMNWLGKSYAKLLRNLPPETLLTEDAAHNAKPENAVSENFLIQGDNLEVLKHLKAAYAGEIKMIYIDPPYNTGSDGFVYHDDRKFTPEQLAGLANISVEEAGRILSFTAKKSNSHSAWLTFMYPRLYIARELLREDGVIFISIDDNEAAQLKLLCDEVFGEGNFVDQISWNKRIPKNDKGIGSIHEFIFIYAKNLKFKHEFKMRKNGLDDIYDFLDKLKENKTDLKEAEKEIKKLYKKNEYDRGITLYNSLDNNYRLWGKINMSWPNADTFGPRYDIYHPITRNPVKIPDRGWRWKEETFNSAAKISEGKYTEIEQRYDGSVMCGQIWFAKDEDTQPSSITYLDDVNSFLLRTILSLKSDGGIEVENLFGSKSYFSYPKPTSLLRTLLGSLENTENSIILDFFAGSGTTAHAVMQLNAEDGGNRKFICVQIAEKIDEKSEAFKAGYDTIFDITKARIEKAAEKIVGADFMSARNNDTETIRADIKSAPTKDFGFKIYKTTENFRAVSDADFSPEHEELPLFTHLNDEQRRTLLTTWALADGAKLNEKITDIRLGNYRAHLCEKRLYFVNEGLTSADLLAFIQKLDHDAEFNPNRVILLGSAIESRLQKELDQALATYANRKNIAISLIVRN